MPNQLRVKIRELMDPRDLSVRVDSFPFLACDTYALHSDFRIDSLADFDACNTHVLEQARVLYVNGKIPNFKDHLCNLNLKPLEVGRERILFVGDTDDEQDTYSFKSLQSQFSKIYSVNLRLETDCIFALPLGLESQSYRSAGNLTIFLQQKNKPLRRNRSIGILLAWNDQTNLAKRDSARRELRPSKEVYEVKKRIPARNIHKLMRNSFFVACPIGNGKDTHRVWESLYLGAIPVMLREANLATNSNWPIHLIDNWNELASLSYGDLRSMYKEMYPDIGKRFQSLQDEIMQLLFKK